jgi:hypothetical protein
MAAPKDLDELKTQALDPINAKDGPLALKLWIDLVAGDVAKINGDIAKAKSEGLTGPAAILDTFVKTHKFDPVAKTWGSLQDEINSAKGIAGEVGPDISGFLSALVNKNTWLRIGEGAIGIILLGIGVSIIAKSSSAGQTATKVAKTAVKVVK